MGSLATEPRRGGRGGFLLVFALVIILQLVVVIVFFFMVSFGYWYSSLRPLPVRHLYTPYHGVEPVYKVI